jgi:xanthine dehydrogenase YagR molybdenum-binding subunit
VDNARGERRPSAKTSEKSSMGRSIWDPRYGGFLNADLAEYVVPVNADIGSIEVEFIDEPDFKFNNAGAKGLGEVSMTGVAPAIANAIYHATGCRLRELPIRIEHLL